jgi:hypothetical protein
MNKNYLHIVGYMNTISFLLQHLQFHVLILTYVLFHFVRIWYSFHIISSICKTWLSHHNIFESKWITLKRKVPPTIAHLINPQTREATFALFVGVVEHVGWGKMFLLQTHMPIQHFQSSWKIPSVLKIIKKNCHKWNEYWTKKCTNLVWKSGFDIQEKIVEH